MKANRIGLVSAVASALVLCGAQPCAASDSDRDSQADGPGVPDLGSAKSFYAEGRKKLKEHDFNGALADFQHAEEFRATPQAERYIGGCLDALGRYREAMDWYDRFLAHVPAHWASQGQHVRQRENEIRALPGKVQIQSNPVGASVTIDGKDRAAVTPAAIDLPPGPHKIRLAQAGHAVAEKSIDVTFASSQSVVVQLQLEETAPPALVADAPAAPADDNPSPPSDGTESPPPVAASGGHNRLPAYLTAGVAVLAAGTGAAFGVVALSDKKAFDRDPTKANADRRNSDALVADVAFGVAVAAGITSAALFLFTKKDAPPAATDTDPDPPRTGERASARPHVAFTAVPWVSAHGGGSGFVVQF